MRTFQEYEGGIENPSIGSLIRNHEAWRVKTIHDHDFSISSSHKLWILFLAHHLIPHLYWKKNLKNTSRKSWIRQDITWWRQFYNTMTSRIDVLLACGCSFLSFPRAGIGVWDTWAKSQIQCVKYSYYNYWKSYLPFCDMPEVNWGLNFR